MKIFINKLLFHMYMDSRILKELITEQKKDFEKKEKFVERTILKEIKQYIKLPHVVIISGLRRSGKSTLLKEIKHTYYKNEDIYYFNFEDERLINFTLNDFNLLYEIFMEVIGKSNIFFLDEIQVVDGWEAFVRRMYEKGFKFFITGSNSSMLSREMGTKLTGRSISIELYPFSFKECLSYKNINTNKDLFLTEDRAIIKKEFNKYLEKGGLPEYRIYNNDKTLIDLYENILYKDVIVRYNLTDEKSLKELTHFIFSNYGKEISYNNLKSMLNLGSVNTVKNYIDHLENSFLIFTIPKYNESLKKQIYAKKKVYVIDTGLINLISFKFSKNSGRILENIVFLELKRRNKEIFYHKEKSECDFVIKDKLKIIQAIQVTQNLDESNKNREIEGTLEALKKYKLKKGLILTYNQDEEINIDNKKIIVKPVWKWLLE